MTTVARLSIIKEARKMARKIFSPEVKEALSHINILWDNLPINLLIQVVVVTICYVILHKGYKGAKKPQLVQGFHDNKKGCEKY